MYSALNEKRSLQNTYESQGYAASIVLDKNTGKKKLELASEIYFNHCVNKFREGERVTLQVTNKKPRRTIQQNSFWWAYLTIASQETGHTPEELHEWAKTACMPTRIVKIMGDPVRMKKSTTELTVTEFSELIEKFAQKTGIPPPPIENYFDKN